MTRHPYLVPVLVGARREGVHGRPPRSRISMLFVVYLFMYSLQCHQSYQSPSEFSKFGGSAMNTLFLYKKTESSLCFMKHHAVKMYGGVEVLTKVLN